MAGVPSMLITTLDDLIADELKRFKFWLSNKLPEGFDSIGRGKLEGKGVLETVDLMVRAYGEEDAVKVTLYALRKTDQNNLAQKLEKAHIMSREKHGSPDMRIVLVGKSGAGKSASGNTILGRKAFKSEFSPGSVTKNSEKLESTKEGRALYVIDTPGIFDTSTTDEEVKCEIEKCISLSVPGPHVFLLVIRLGRFTQEERSAVRWIQERFGEEALRYTMVLFTGGDQLDDTPVVEFLSHSSDLQEVIRHSGGGYHVFNNRDKNNLTQVPELLQKIDKMVERNGCLHYTNEMYQKAERRIREEEERKRREEEEKKRQEAEKIRAEEERRWKEAEKKIREEEEKKREEAEQRIREEEEKKREEAERRIREEETRKREEAEKRIREEEEKKREEAERRIREEEMTKRKEEMRLKEQSATQNDDGRRESKFERETRRVVNDVRKFFK